VHRARPTAAARAPAPSARAAHSAQDWLAVHGQVLGLRAGRVRVRGARAARSQRAPSLPRRIGSQFLGKYSDSVPAAFVYPSSNFEDDLAWGATWLFRKTGEQHFLAVRARRPAGPARSAA